MRVVSLACSNTEIVCALGCAELLVGVDDHSDRPADVVATLPRVGPDLHVETARVAALEPDLVLASLSVPGHEQVVAGLERAGLPYLALEPSCLSDVYRDIRTVARALGVTERGEALVGKMQRQIRAEPGAASAARPRVLVQWWNRPTIAPGRLSWVTDLIHLAGGVNPLAAETHKSRPLSDEEVAELNPDAIVISWCGVKPEKYRPEVVFRNPAWRDVAALRSEQVYCVPEADLGRPGPGLMAGFEKLLGIVEASRARREGSGD